MFSRLKDFVYNHRRKFLVTGAIVGGTVLALRYAQRKLREFTENEAKEIVERSRRNQHFKSIERTCDQTVLSLSPTIHDSILKLVSTDDLVDELFKEPSEKMAIWQKLKVRAFTRVTVLVYAYSMLVLLLRIQLNVVGGYLVGDPSDGAALSSELQQLYLSLCHHFRDSGLKQLCRLIESHVQPITENVSLKKSLSLRDVEELFWSIQNSVESNIHESPIKTLGKFVLPPKDKVNVDSLEEAEITVLHSMIDETQDLLESDEVASLMRSCVSQSYAAIMDKLACYFLPANAGEPVPGPSNVQDVVAWSQAVNGSMKTGSFVHPNSVTMPLARLIPIINKLTEQACSRKDSCVNQLLRNELVKSFGANVYEAFGLKN